MLAYTVLIAVVIRTELEVPDNRLCNCSNAGDWCRLGWSELFIFALCGQSV